MKVTFYWYPKCGTCRNAKKWLDQHEVDYTAIHIVETPPTKQVLQDILAKSGLPLQKLFNTSGAQYRELGMKDKIKTATEDELLDLLSNNGMLIKRPLVTDGSTATIGFKEEEYQAKWG